MNKSTVRIKTSGQYETGALATSTLGGLIAGGAGAANLGIAGACGIAGGAIDGSGGKVGEGNIDAPGALAGGCFCDPAAPPAAFGGLTEIIWVYGLGPLAITGSLGEGARGVGVENTPVAPSPSGAAGMTEGGLGDTGIGGGKLVNTAAAGAAG
jgi:hypothetical protein